jgi:hypothetical protein
MEIPRRIDTAKAKGFHRRAEEVPGRPWKQRSIRFERFSVKVFLSIGLVGLSEG